MFKPFGLYVILTDPVSGYLACGQAAVDEGVRFLQLRMKKTPKNQVMETAKQLRKITKGSDTLFIVNDDLDIAIESDADGIHLGQDDMSLSEARDKWDIPGKIFGLSTHSIKQVEEAITKKPDYIGVGPVFPTPTKEFPDPDLGLETMGEMIRLSPLPAVAIGGINEENLGQVLTHGAENFCAVRTIIQSKEPGTVIRKMMDQWANHMKNKRETGQ